MEEMKVMTVEQVINITIQNLQQIQVPMGLMEQIGLPVHYAIGNLIECANALAKEREEAKQKMSEAHDIDENGNGGEDRNGETDEAEIILPCCTEEEI